MALIISLFFGPIWRRFEFFFCQVVESDAHPSDFLCLKLLRVVKRYDKSHCLFGDFFVVDSERSLSPQAPAKVNARTVTQVLPGTGGIFFLALHLNGEFEPP